MITKENKCDYSKLISDALVKLKEFRQKNELNDVFKDIYYSVNNKDITFNANPGDTFFLYSWLNIEKPEKQVMKRYFQSKITGENHIGYSDLFSGNALYSMIDSGGPESPRYYNLKFNVEDYASIFIDGTLKNNINNNDVYSELITDIINYYNYVIEEEYLYYQVEHSKEEILKIVYDGRINDVTGKLKVVYFKIWLENEKEQI